MCVNLLTDNYGLYPPVPDSKTAIIAFLHTLILHDRAIMSIRKRKLFPFLPFHNRQTRQWWGVNTGTGTRSRCLCCLHWHLTSSCLRRCRHQRDPLCHFLRHPFVSGGWDPLPDVVVICVILRAVFVDRMPVAEPLAVMVVVVDVFFKGWWADLVVLGKRILFVVVPSPPTPPL